MNAVVFSERLSDINHRLNILSRDVGYCADSNDDYEISVVQIGEASVLADMLERLLKELREYNE